MLMGRDMMKMAKIFPQSVLSCKLLVGTDGKEKMSKSLGNYISVTDEPGNMYGKIMSIPDTAMFDYFELCTYTPMDRIEEIKTRYESGSENPKDIKMKLAREIVEIYHGRDKAVKAENDFIETFSKGNIPDSLEEIRVSSGAELSSVLIENGLIASKTEYRRLIAEGAVSDMKTKEKITDQFARITEDMIIKIGKKRFIKITVE
jgi:tyrosyl-tRNA synthetase